jgi:hypothetical protein
MVFMFKPTKLISMQTGSKQIPINFNLSWFSWTFLTVYSKAKLKSGGDGASP